MRRSRPHDEGPPAIRADLPTTSLRTIVRLTAVTSSSPHSVDQQCHSGNAPRGARWSNAMTEAEQNAKHALQEAMDRRDNGGETGH